MPKIGKILLVSLAVPPVVALVGFLFAWFMLRGMAAYAVFLGATAIGGMISLVGFLSTLMLLVFSRSRRRDWLTWVAMFLFLVFLIALQQLADH